MIFLSQCNNCGRDALLTCRGCNKSHYCGQFCQQKDWTIHKNKCRNEPSGGGTVPGDELINPQLVAATQLNISDK